MKHLHSSSRAHSGSGLGRDEANQENGAQNLIRRSLPEGTAFSRYKATAYSSAVFLSAGAPQIPMRLQPDCFKRPNARPRMCAFAEVYLQDVAKRRLAGLHFLRKSRAVLLPYGQQEASEIIFWCCSDSTTSSSGPSQDLPSVNSSHINFYITISSLLCCPQKFYLEQPPR